MDQSLFKFDLIAEDPTTHARAGVLHTPHGDIETPIFMPVGTKANVKGVPTETVKQLGAQIVLANTYHLSMRPGEDTIAELGGLHKFMNWHGPILTDSGGFQVFSHNDAVKLTDEGVRFIVNDYDGRHVFWTPEDNMEIAMKLGSDICMQLDQCPGYPATRAYVERAVELSSMWAERCYKAHTRDDQALFGIVQGGMHLDLRLRSLRHLEECGDFPGYGIGGYSVGEDHETMFETLAPLVSEYMPKHKPRYLMGVGTPSNIIEGVARGVDFFDVKAFGADFAYTMDGGFEGELEYENFNAASAKIEIQGRNVHPGYAKDKMINAIQVACELNALLPAWERPEHTEGYDGFYHCIALNGTVDQAQISYIVRDHDSARFEARKNYMQECVDLLVRKYGEGVLTLTLKDSYYNMRKMVEPHPQVIDKAIEAMKMAGVEPLVKPIRGGTDGARLSFMGLPCPNIFTGGMNFHGRYEYCSLTTMHKAMQVILNLAQLWTK